MTINKRKKNSRQRGSHTHGWGAMKKHRGSGNRGGAGKAGTGKRSDSTKPSIWKNTKYFGKYGFISRKHRLASVNVSYLEEHLESFVSKKLAKQDQEDFSINLNDIGFKKLLGSGKVTKRFIITCQAASARAVKSIEAKGGKVILPKKEEVSDGPEGHTSKSS